MLVVVIVIVVFGFVAVVVVVVVVVVVAVAGVVVINDAVAVAVAGAVAAGVVVVVVVVVVAAAAWDTWIAYTRPSRLPAEYPISEVYSFSQCITCLAIPGGLGPPFGGYPKNSSDPPCQGHISA